MAMLLAQDMPSHNCTCIYGLAHVGRAWSKPNLLCHEIDHVALSRLKTAVRVGRPKPLAS